MRFCGECNRTLFSARIVARLRNAIAMNVYLGPASYSLATRIGVMTLQVAKQLTGQELGEVDPHVRQRLRVKLSPQGSRTSEPCHKRLSAIAEARCRRSPAIR